MSFEAVDSQKLKQRQKGLFGDFAEACKAWKSAQKEAKANGEKFEGPKPKKPLFRKFLRKRVSGKDKAESMASLYQEKWDAKRGKKGDKALDDLADDEPSKKGKKASKEKELKDDEDGKKRKKS